ncbi:hypothetical protein BP5796_00102 [Coleophoma crateriformis]|uniref:HMG box domain-containing protein n=1 Tax=Coleophoma crateriformis TaxID=565419 RepID=A0A3D8T726_9HELO|nr:hypothetical protein BP5796_00102 [Coleophoma crateriformis]
MPLATPPAQHSDMFQHGLHHLAEHNASTPYPQGYYDGSVRSAPAYSSPMPEYGRSYPGHRRSRPSYDGYGPEFPGSAFQTPEYQGRAYPDTPLTSPLTPHHHVLRTRSQQIRRGSPEPKRLQSARSRIPALQSTKKGRKTKAKSESDIHLDGPLSVVTKDWEHVPLVDIEAYVNRSSEERRREIDEGKKPGKVKRPMNSFMLYRKAYQARTKEYCLQNNHQVVSKVCGRSWPMESDQIRAQYIAWAKLESENHAKAHPEYKFSPTKAEGTRQSEEPDEEDLSDLDDYDYREGRTKKKHRPTPVQYTAAYPPTDSAYQYSRESSTQPNHGGAYNKSHFLTSNPGKVYPEQYNPGLPPGQYYEQETVDRNGGQFQDVLLRKSDMHHVGLPSSQDYDLFNQGQNQYHHGATPPPDHRIDPLLMGQEQAVYDGHFSSPEPQYFSSYADDPNMIDPLLHLDAEGGMNSLQIHEQDLDILRGHHIGWEVNPLDVGQEFDMWMDGK